MAFQRLPLMRSEVTGQFDEDEDASLLTIKYSPGVTEQNIPGSGTSAAFGDGDLISNKPIVIYDYKVELVTNCITQMWQYYADDDDATNASNWNLASQEFLMSLKQHRLTGGAINATTSSTTMGVHTLSYRAKKYWSKKHKEFRWIRPPIVLSKNKKNMFGLSVHNASNLDAQSYYATVTIKRWHVMT